MYKEKVGGVACPLLYSEAFLFFLLKGLVGTASSSFVLPFVFDK